MYSPKQASTKNSIVEDALFVSTIAACASGFGAIVELSTDPIFYVSTIAFASIPLFFMASVLTLAGIDHQESEPANKALKDIVVALVCGSAVWFAMILASPVATVLLWAIGKA